MKWELCVGSSGDRYVAMVAEPQSGQSTFAGRGFSLYLGLPEMSGSASRAPDV